MRRIAEQALPVGDLVSTLQAGIADQERLREAGDLPGLLLADAGFHHAIVRGAQNAIADTTYQPLADRQRRLNLLWMDPAGAQSAAVLGDHRRLIRLISRRDADGFERALRAHLDRSRHAHGAGPVR